MESKQDFYLALGLKVRKIREGHDFTQKDVAEHLQIGVSNYAKIETGMRELSLREAVLLADLYGLTVDEMIYDQESKGSEGQKRSTIQQARLWQQLDEADRETLFRVMDVMQTKLEFQSFFKKHAR